MNKIIKNMTLHGWDDEKVYFFDERNGQEWCVTDESELYEELVQICKKYFEKLTRKREELG